jgi:hypothetical protein
MMSRRVLLLAALLLLPLGLSGCVVAPARGYYGGPPVVSGGVYVSPRPYAYRPYLGRPYYARPYYPGYSWRRW